jgi:hypothetical protein
MTTKELAAKIGRLCDKDGCSEKLRKIHFAQFVYRQWHPHPPRAFFEWWSRHPDNFSEGGSGPVIAFNAKCYYEQFCEARQLGLLSEIPKPIHNR